MVGLKDMVDQPIRLGEAGKGRGSRGGGRRKKAPANQASGANGHPSNPQPPIPNPRPQDIVEAANLRLDSIRRSPYQPRQSFPEAEIAELAESLRTLGQRVPIAVRFLGERFGDGSPIYELLDGERRWRAAKRAGLTTIRAEIQEASDAEARAIVVASAVQRKDLNAIERARAYRAMLDAGDAPDPPALAKLLSISESEVRNKLRLLELPEAMQREIISAEMPEWIGRSLAKYAGPDLAPLLDEIRTEIRTRASTDWMEPVATPEQLTNLCIDIVANFTRPIEGAQEDYDWRFAAKPHNGHPPVFTPDEAQLAELGVIEVPAADGRGAAQRRATNVKLWDKLQGAHVNKLYEEREARRQGRKAGVEGRGKKNADPKREPTPAEQKAAAEEAKRKAAEARAQLKRRVANLRTDWLRYLISRWILDDSHTAQCSINDLLRLLLMLGQQWHLNHYAQHGVLDDVRRLLGAGGQWKSVAGRDSDQLTDAAMSVCARIFWDARDKTACPLVPRADVEAIAKSFRVDTAAAWAREKLGPLTEEYFAARTKEQLAALAKELKIELPAGGKAEQVAFLAGREKLPMPKELR